MNYQVTLVESDEGVAVWCEDLPGCVSQGATKEEAIENIREAIREYLAAVPEVERQFGTRVSREQVVVCCLASQVSVKKPPSARYGRRDSS
jgi:predicted RNase H-like HicB family nuclease